MENSPAAWSRRSGHPEPWTACGWSRDSQRERFVRIEEALRPSAGESLLDFGCGLGDFADLLSPRVDYLGFDWSLGMFSRAIERHPDRRFATTLRDGDTWDYVVCCGPFNLADNWSKAQTWALMRMLWNRTERAMAVSLYYGNDPACIRYPSSEVAATAATLADRWSLERWRKNDLLVVMHR